MFIDIRRFVLALQHSGQDAARFQAALALRESALRQWPVLTFEARSELRSWVLHYILGCATHPLELGVAPAPQLALFFGASSSTSALKFAYSARCTVGLQVCRATRVLLYKLIGLVRNLIRLRVWVKAFGEAGPGSKAAGGGAGSAAQARVAGPP